MSCQINPVEKVQFTRHLGPVTSVSQITDSKWSVTSAYDGAVAKFDIEDGEIKLLGYHRHLVNRSVVNPSGTKAASCSSDYTIAIWDLATDTLERILYGHSDDVEDFVFISETRGASASRDCRILPWDLATGSILRVMEGHEKDVLSLAYHQGRIYSSGDDKTLRIWDVETGELVRSLGPFEVETDTCAIDVFHERILLGCDDGCIRIFDIPSGKLIETIHAHTSAIKKIAVSLENGDILSAAYDQRLLIWDAESFHLKRELEKNLVKWERSLSWSNDGTCILAGTFDGGVVVWDSASGRIQKEVKGTYGVDGNACFNEVAILNGMCATASDDGYIRLIHLEEEKSYKYEPPGGRLLMNGITVDSERGIVAGGSHTQCVLLFRYHPDGLMYDKEVFLGEGPINTIRISRMEDIFVGCYSGAIVRMDSTGDVKDTMHFHGGAVKALRLHPTKEIGVSCSAAGELMAWTFDGERYRSFLGHTAIINDVDLSLCGRFLASVSRDFTLKVYDLEKGHLLHSFHLGRRSLKSVCFVDQETIVVGDYWGHVIRVYLRDGSIQKRKIARNGISSIARFGRDVVASSYDGALYCVSPEDLEVRKTHREMMQRQI